MKCKLYILWFVLLIVKGYELNAQITLAPGLTVGQSAIIQLDENLADTMLVITYRPNSNIAVTDTLRSLRPTSIFIWTPARSGVVMISTSSGINENVSIGFSDFSWSGLLVMLLAGSILFGGVSYAFRTLFRKDDIPTAQPPDT